MRIKYLGTDAYQERNLTGYFANWQPGQIGEVNEQYRISKLLALSDLFVDVDYESGEVPVMARFNPLTGGIGKLQACSNDIYLSKIAQACQSLGSRQFGISSVSAQSTPYTYFQKVALEADYDAVRLAYYHHSATTPTLNAVVAATETSLTDTVDHLFEPMVSGTRHQVKDSASDVYGWKSVTWNGGSATFTPAVGTATAPSVTMSDWIPIKSVPRAAGEENTLPLLMVRMYGANAATQAYDTFTASVLMRTATTANNGRILQSGALNGDGVGTISDANRPGSLASSCIPLGVQYRTRANGIFVIGVGDSITQNNSIAADVLSSWGARACAKASTPTRPVTWWNCGASSQNGTVFTAAGDVTIAALQPNAIVYAAYTPNDYTSPTAAQLQVYCQSMLARLHKMIDYCNKNRIALITWTGLPHFAGLSAAADAVRKQFNTDLRAIDASVCTVIDFDSLVTDGASPANYALGMGQGDGVHPSEAALEVLGTALSAELKTLI